MKHREHDEAEQFLLGLFDFEKQRKSRRLSKPFTLDRVREALQRLGNPEKSLKFVHLAGTKGKGSTSLYLEQLLRRDGCRVGVFTSPHLVSLNERIRVGEVCIPSDALRHWSEKLHEMNDAFFDGELTFFEFLFLMALLHFKAEGVDWVVLETGLGGRLDATNVVEPVCCVLTLIHYDHCDILGDTLALIAAEKAGIIKRGVPVVALKQSEEVEAVFRDFAKQKDAPLIWAGDHQHGPAQQNVDLALQTYSQICQRAPRLGRDELLALTLPGRWHEIQTKGAQWVLDTAHNEISVRAVAERCKIEGRFPQMVFAMADSRNPKDLLALLKEHVDEVLFTDLPGGRPGLAPEALHKIFEDLGGRSKVVKAQALEAEISSLRGRVLVTGSFYLVGECYKILGFDSSDLIPPLRGESP